MNKWLIITAGIFFLIYHQTAAKAVKNTNPKYEVINPVSPNSKTAVKGTIKGTVFDKKEKTPVEYATISILKASDNSLVTGAITNNKGVFIIKNLKPGRYNVSISFIGYDTKIIKNIEISKSNKINNLGNIAISLSRKMLEEVSIKGNASNVEYKIDKKVVSVSDKLTSAGMSAVEVLETVPSVKVDMDGNIELRGSSNFTVLIDGRPTILDAADILQQTPASSIQNIEIITNASAKYSPEGTGGIINIITKKNKNKGISGILNAQAGSYETKSGDFLINLKQKDINFFVSGGYNDRNRKSTIEDKKYMQTETYSFGESERSRTSKKISTGLNWDITERDQFNISATYNDYDSGSESLLDFYENTLKQVNSNTSDRERQAFSFDGGFSHKFPQKDHLLSIDFNYRKMDMENNTINILNGDNIKKSTNTVMSGPGTKGEIRMDYTLPLNSKSKFEAGMQYQNVHKEDATSISRLPKIPDEINPLSYDVDFKREIYSVYAMYSTSMGDFSWQIGLRGENTEREVSSTENDKVSKNNGFDLFPTAHFSYQLPKNNQIQASYSRRIERPRGFNLLPREIWYDMYSVRKGNPDLKNEYVHVMELTYLKDWEKSRLSFEIYNRITNNKMERIVSAYPTGDIPESEKARYNNVTLQTVNNVGKSYALGSEIMYNVDILEFWNISWSADAYNYKITSDVKGVKDLNTFSWSSSVTNKFRILKRFDLQIDNRYYGESKRSQSVRKPMYSANVALRTKISNNLSLTAQYRNILNTWKYEIETTNKDYRVYNSFKPKPNFSISLSYRINNFKLKKKRNGETSEFSDDDMF